MTLSLFTSCSLLPSIEGAREEIEMQCCCKANPEKRPLNESRVTVSQTEKETTGKGELFTTNQ